MPLPQRLITLPENMVKSFHRLEARPAPQWFATCDPGQPLGSGGGTVHALLDCWKQSGTPDFYEWLTSERRLIIHAGGQSRRLPAYASIGKSLMPIPILRGSLGQRPDQSLVDLQVALYDELFDRAPTQFVAMIVAGDAMLRPKTWPTVLPEAEVLCIGMRSDPESAQNFGAFFVPHDRPDSLAFFLQKPAPEQTRLLAVQYDCLLDAGIWLLTELAVRALMAKSGVADATIDATQPYDLYSDFGPALGQNPTHFDATVSPLRASVVPVDGQFLHFGTSRQLIESVTALHDQTHHAAPLGFLTSAKRRANQHVQNSTFSSSSLPEGQPCWVENSYLNADWTLLGENVVTGVPPNRLNPILGKGICLDIVPIGEEAICLRTYGIDDSFKGSIGATNTKFMGIPLTEWLSSRGVALPDEPDVDIQNAHMFPVLTGGLTQEWLDWMISGNPSKEFSSSWIVADKLSASDLLARSSGDRIYVQRHKLLANSLVKMQANHRSSVFYSQDLERTADILNRYRPDYQPERIGAEESLVKKMHDRMFRSALLRASGSPKWEDAEAEAFGALREAILGAIESPKPPVCGVATDQIVWGRSPLRFDLAGGWTDTPPYCLLNGGRVLNMSINLNGQPPVQVFLRRSESQNILLRSIDLGTQQRITSFNELCGNLTEHSEFSLAQAALSLAGFGPETGEPDLGTVLRHFGGGIEMSLLAAVPKGSGLGTSSILAATILAALSEFCSLNWKDSDVMAKTLALEQILSTGGGWQDQVGGCLPGIKELETRPGLIQSPTCRWLPDRILGPDTANSVALLYYTGITRVAKSVLREIVRGMFLNSGPRLETLRRIGENVDPTSDAIRRNDWDELGASVKRSWELNQELDSGTNPAAVQLILSKVEDYLLGAKLLGAGGGGFLLMIAKDRQAAQRVKSTLKENPPSPKARFFDFSISQVGLEVTKS